MPVPVVSSYLEVTNSETVGDYACEPGFTIAAGEQPQQRFETFGAGALSDTELIAIMLHTGTHGHSVLGLASQLIAQAGWACLEKMDTNSGGFDVV